MSTFVTSFAPISPVLFVLQEIDAEQWQQLLWCFSDLQNKKGNILQASVDYIKRLKKEQMAMSELVSRQEELERTNRQLALDIQVTQLSVYCARTDEAVKVTKVKA